MPTLDDAPTKQVAKLTGVNLLTTNNPAETPTTADEADLVQIYDVSTGEAKAITLAELAKVFGLSLT